MSSLRVFNLTGQCFVYKIISGPDDRQITVSFTNGKVEKIPNNVAVWIPKKVYERIALEIKMPREARESLTMEERYPIESLEGEICLCLR